MNTVTVFNSLNVAEADMVRARLEAAGFESLVAQDISALSNGGFTLAAGGVRVQVPEHQAEEALAFLKSDEEATQ